MEHSEYQRIFENEDTHWWYRGLKDIVMKFLPKEGKTFNLLDAGCGTGGFLASLFNTKYSGEFTGIDFSKQALFFSKARGLSNLSQGDVCSLPYPDNLFDVVTSLDVLYCNEVGNDLQALSEFYRVLKPNGVLILNLPAYEWLRSDHDQVIHTRHRYTVSEVHKKLHHAHFVISYLTYRSFLPFPLIAGKRVLQKISRSTGLTKTKSVNSDVSPEHPLLNKALRTLLALENKLIPTITFPFGSSVFSVSKKKP